MKHFWVSFGTNTFSVKTPQLRQLRFSPSWDEIGKPSKVFQLLTKVIAFHRHPEVFSTNITYIKETDKELRNFLTHRQIFSLKTSSTNVSLFGGKWSVFLEERGTCSVVNFEDLSYCDFIIFFNCAEVKT